MVVPMLDRFPVSAVLPAQNADRARAFYRDVLGLELLSDPDDEVLTFRAGSGTTVVLTETEGRVPVKHPVVHFAVEEIDTLVPALKERGATFVPLSAGGSYAEAGTRTPDVANLGTVKSAFLRDSEGNVLALTQVG